MLLLLLVSSLLYLVVLFSDCASGNQVVVKQIDTSDSTYPTWVVNGIASYEHGGGNTKIFEFHCTSTSNNGDDLVWTKVGESTIGGDISLIDNGLKLRFNPPVSGNVGTYKCRDTGINEEVQYVLTNQSPAALAASSSLVRYVGDDAVIEMYASALTPITASMLLWKKDNAALNGDIFSSDKKTVTISDVQLADAGVYKIIVVLSGGQLTATANTTLQVIEPPSITAHPDSYQTNKEWESVQITCTATASLSVTISWYKVNGVLPLSSTVNDNTNSSGTTSTLTITDLRSDDSGIYYCTASDGTRSNSSNNATLIVTNSTRLTYTSQTDNNTQHILSDPFLFLSEPGVIDCEGSGPLSWIGPSMNSVSTSVDSTVYQYTVPDTGFTGLNVTSLSAFPDGLYTCLSTVNRSIYLTNDNPAIYTEIQEVVVGSISDTVLKVYVNGTDPSPTSNDIKWFYNDAPLPINTNYYELGDDNKQLVISNVSSELIIGRYHINVTTTQGTQSVYINVSYFDPPVVTLIPDNTELVVNEGETVVLNCTVTSVQSTSLNWYKSGNVLVDSTDGILVLSNVTVGDASDYSCEAVDIEAIYTIRKTVTLTVQYAPIVTVETIHVPEPQPFLSHIYHLEDGPTHPTYFCSVSAVPEVIGVQWYFNGNTELPTGVTATEDSSGGNVKYKLHWIEPVLYKHNGTYTCRAHNTIGESTANVYITVQAYPHITTIYSNDLSTSINSSTISFTSSSLTVSSSVICIGYGIPYPSIHWVDSDGHELTNIYYVNSCGLYGGTAVSTLMLNATQVAAQEPVYCRVMSEIGNETRAVSITQNRNTNIANESSLPSDDVVPSVSSDIVNIRLKLNKDTCISNLNSVETSLKSVLTSIIKTCDSLLEVSLSFNTDGCSPSSYVPIIIASIKTNTSSSTNNALQTVSQWIRSKPAIIIQNQPYQLDPNCTLIVPTQRLPDNIDSSFFACAEQPTSQATPTATSTEVTTPEATNNTPPATTDNNSQMVIWLSIVGVILFLLLVVVASLIVVLYLCAKTVNKSGRGVLVGASKPAWSDPECIQMNTIRKNSSLGLRDSSPLCNRLQQSTSMDSSTNDGIEGRGEMQENPEYVIGPQLELLQTLSDEQIDSAQPPNYQWVTDNITRDSGYIETMRSSAALQSQETMRSTTPIQEKLYQHGRGDQDEPAEDPTYAVIRSDARKQSADHHQHQHSSNTDVHNRMQPPSESTRRATLPSNMRYSPNKRPQYNGPTSPPHYTKPHRSITATSSPAVNQQHPMPYSQPVSSMGSLRNVGLHSSRPAPYRPPIRPIANRSISTPNTIKEEPSVTSANSSPLRTVDESDGGQWYNDGEDNSDIVTPVGMYDEVSSISPYAVTLSSQVEPHPYSQPSVVGSDWQLSTVTGGSSPSTIRPNQIPVSPASQPFVKYETINV